MNIKANTIISFADEPITLLKWMKNIEKENGDAKITAIEFAVKDGKNVASVTFANGEKIESAPFLAVGALDKFIQHVDEGNITRIGTNAEIVGNLKLDAGIGDFEGKTGLQGDVLTSNGGSIEWKKPAGGGSKLYLHMFNDIHNEARFYIISRSNKPLGLGPGPICSKLYHNPQDFIDGGFIFQGECKKILSGAGMGLGVFVINGYSENPTIEYIAGTAFPEVANETITDY